MTTQSASQYHWFYHGVNSNMQEQDISGNAGEFTHQDWAQYYGDYWPDSGFFYYQNDKAFTPSPPVFHPYTEFYDFGYGHTMVPNQPALVSTYLMTNSAGTADPIDGAYSNNGATIDAIPQSVETRQDMPKPAAGVEKRPGHLRRRSSNAKTGAVATKLHGCSHCGRTFARRHDLDRHTHVHTGVKPYACPCCFKSFARSDARGRHFRNDPGCQQGPRILEEIKKRLRCTI